MKNLNEYIKESLLDDEEDLIENDDVLNIKWVKQNYKISGNREFTIKNGILNAPNTSFQAKPRIESLTNGEFKFGKVFEFKCSSCWELKTLEGGPEEVEDYFDCSDTNIIDLKGAPKKVGGSFNCSYCDNLKTLEGAPQIVNKDFYCSFCNNLISLKGAPKEVNSFSCNGCANLKTLENSPKMVKNMFNCSHCYDLTNLEGSPRIVNKFICAYCHDLRSLKGAPNETKGDFRCDNCDNLKSLEYAPKKIGGELISDIK